MRWIVVVVFNSELNVKSIFNRYEDIQGVPRFQNVGLSKKNCWRLLL